MRFIVAVHPGTDKNPVYSVTVPDLAGCTAKGDDLDMAVLNAREAAATWLENALDTEAKIPEPRTLTKIREEHPDMTDCIWAAVEIDIAALDTKALRINITLPGRVLRRLDAQAERLGESRSGYVSQLVMRDKAY